MPDSNFLTWRTCAAWASGSRLRWMTPRPPACAMAIASLASVTVSMAEAMIGILSEISRVMRVRISASDGSTSDNPGVSRTSSKVSASRRVPLDFWSIATPVTRLAGSVAGTVGSEIAPALRRNGSLARDSTTRFGLAPVVSTARRRNPSAPAAIHRTMLSPMWGCVKRRTIPAIRTGGDSVSLPPRNFALRSSPACWQNASCR